MIPQVDQRVEQGINWHGVARFDGAQQVLIPYPGAREGDIAHVAYGYGLFTGGLGAHYGAEDLGATVVREDLGVLHGLGEIPHEDLLLGDPADDAAGTPDPHSLPHRVPFPLGVFHEADRPLMMRRAGQTIKRNLRLKVHADSSIAC